MKHLRVNGTYGEFSIALPTNIKEITDEYLEAVTKHIVIAPDYSLIGVVYKDTLQMVINVAKKNKAANMNVVPIFIRSGQTDSDFINGLKINTPLVLAGSDIAMGHHINAPKNKLTINNIVALCSGDKTIYTKYLLDNTPVYFLEFKLVPNCAIHGAFLEDTSNYVNPFVTKVAETPTDEETN